MGGLTRVLIAAYRDWAKNLVARAKIDRWPDGRFFIEIAETEAQLEHLYEERRPDIVLLIGWSWLVPAHIYEETQVICAHPSPLPRYRGGSPLQHQIINGETESALTFFRVAGDVDAGPILAQYPFSLDGTLDDVLDRVEYVGSQILPHLLYGVCDGWLTPVSQATNGTIFKRRKPEESEVTLADLQTMTARELVNKVRALAHPDYPRAFILMPDGEKVELWDARLADA